ncbi:MAG: hypothetical protein PHR66_14155 [Desulfuromonadaceae bacterium]|nr:hypothetical protein [Desulfuromonadaceae bacterium]
MKVYLFNSENGLYEGETFENADTIKHVAGMTTVPPPDYGHGQVPVFDCSRNEWSLIPVDSAKQLLTIRTSASTERTS